MLSINTNLSSLIAQGSMKQSTNKLNQAIERMTTGFKINHAKDNAANYSIATNMTTKIGAYNVAEDNAAMGLDLISTAEGTLSQIEDKLQRLRALAEQASNGTYGEQSQSAINAEANALVDEIERIYNNTEYNGINLMKGRVVGTEESKFIKDIDRRDTSNMTKLSSVDENEKLEYGTYSISSAEELAKLATMTNNGLIGVDTEFVLANDIDLSGYSNWTPIGTLENPFMGILDGNGYMLDKLSINTSTSFPVGLLGSVQNALIKNLSVENSSILITGTGPALDVAILCGRAFGSEIINCNVAGNVETYAGEDCAGLVARTDGTLISSCQANIDINSNDCNFTGGLVGVFMRSTMEGSFVVGNISAKRRCAGALGISTEKCLINQTYSNVNVNLLDAGSCVGSFIAVAEGSMINNCYSQGSVQANSNSGGFISAIGWNSNNPVILKNCYNLAEANNASGIFIDSHTSWALSTSVVVEDCFFSDYYNDKGLAMVGAGISSTLNNVSSCDSSVVPFIIENNSVIKNNDSSLSLQVGVSSKNTSQIDVDTGYLLDSVSILRRIGSGTGDYLTMLDKMLAKVSEKQTHLGATSNRLESVLEEITIQRDNLVSSRSTIRDADIAEVSSHYIQQQILQQASATLLATANQSPSIALQLI